MATERELALSRSMAALLAGHPEAEAPADETVHAWRLIRWEADVPLTDEQRSALLSAAGASIVTINQSKPENGAAQVAVTIRTETMQLSVDELVEKLRRQRTVVDARCGI